jgi:hypothetical protein
MFTKAQQRLLYDASSKIKADDFAQLPQDIVDTVMERIDTVTVNLHMQSPQAFLTTLKVSSKGEGKVIDSQELLKKRVFFDIPKSLLKDSYDHAINPELRPLRKIRK